MADMGLIQGAVTGLKVAGDIAKALLDLKSLSEVQGKVIELQAAILAAQSSALAAQSDQFSMIEEIRALKQEVASVKGWEETKQRYRLHNFPSGMFAYALKPESAAGEPAHYVCAKCYDSGRKTILQGTKSQQYGVMLICHECKIQVFERS